MRSTRKLVRLKVVTCVPPFEQLVAKGANCFQNNISKRLHNHSFIIIFFCLLFYSHQMHLKLCARQNARAWLLTCPIIIFFHLLSNVFSTSLHARLSLSHPLVLGVSQYICSQPLDPMGIHLFHYVHAKERMALHDVVQNVFVAIVKDAGFHVS
jgi:hypothetical protein